MPGIEDLTLHKPPIADLFAAEPTPIRRQWSPRTIGPVVSLATIHAGPVHSYRYHFYRRWMQSQPMLLWVLHNPGLGDGKATDSIVDRLTMWSSRLGYGGFVAAALYPVRTPSLEAARRWAAEARDGPEWFHFDHAAAEAGALADRLRCHVRVAAWGQLDAQGDADLDLWLEHFRGKAPNQCLGLSSTGDPLHPAVRGACRPGPDTQLQAFTYPIRVAKESAHAGK